MRKRFAFLICLAAALASGLFGQAIPRTATVLEERTVTPTRRLVLWMPNPKKNPRPAPAETYTCPEETRGHHYTGIARVSLVESSTRKVINTVEIQGSDAGERLDLPYLIHRGYYEVPQIDRNREGRPVLMNLKDYNGDGRASEFALFDAVACMGLPTTLIGFSAKRDEVIQYRIELKTGGTISNAYWIDYLLARRPLSPGFWRYEIDYRGRAGTLDRYEVSYDPDREIFAAVVTSVADENPD